MCGFIGGAINYLMVNYLAIIEGWVEGFSCFWGWELVISRTKVLKRSEICAFFLIISKFLLILPRMMSESLPNSEKDEKNCFHTTRFSYILNIKDLGYSCPKRFPNKYSK